jgi:NADH-quinone oxidoreductase subunit E
MSVRRLAEQQPATFAFSEANLAWAKREVAKYPPGRQASAVISLLWRAQEQEGWVSEPAVRVVAEFLGMARIRVLEIATFYTMFHLEPVGSKAHIQVCGTTPCWLRGANDLKQICHDRIHPEQHHVSADGAFSWEEVECIGACVNAPLVQINADTYEDLTAATFGKLIDDIAAGRPVKAGPQIERQFAAPVGGATSLTGDIYRPGPTPWMPPVVPLADNDAKKPTEGASVRESPAPKGAVQANPEDKKPNPVSKV